MKNVTNVVRIFAPPPPPTSWLTSDRDNPPLTFQRRVAPMVILTASLHFATHYGVVYWIKSVITSLHELFRSTCVHARFPVCLSSLLSQKPHVQMSPHSMFVTVAEARSSSDGSPICSVLPVLWMTSPCTGTGAVMRPVIHLISAVYKLFVCFFT